MRVISGRFKGKKLLLPRDKNTRPLKDLVKESIFNLLEHSNKINITVEEEVFFNTPVAGIQPRSAIGYSKEGYLIMMVVDGRQADSRGVYLEELAIMMMEFNCDEAINLDGGGSSCIVADNRLLNRPVGRNNQREIMSAIGVFYGN